MDGKKDSLSYKMNHELGAQVHTIAPTNGTVTTFRSPEYAIKYAGELIDDALGQVPEGCSVLGVGRSYGGFSLLKAALATRQRFDQFQKLILLESPLHSEQSVTIPPLLLPLYLAIRHYHARQRLAREIVEQLSDDDLKKIITVGEQEDAVVNPNAMHLPGNFNRVEIDNPDDVDSLDFSQAHAITLTADYEPTKKGITGKLPREYRKHLNWSAEKYAMIMRIISAASQ